MAKVKRSLFLWDGVDLPMPRLVSRKHGGELDESVTCNESNPERAEFHCTRDIGHVGSHAALDGDMALVALWDPDGPPASLPPILYPFITTADREPATLVYTFGRLAGLDANVVVLTPDGPAEGDVNIHSAVDGGLSVTFSNGDHDVIGWAELLGVRIV